MGILAALVLIAIAPRAYAEVDGKIIFRANCMSCHKMESKLTGPALDGAFERIMEAKGFTEEQSHDWLMKWIRNSRAVIASGDAYAVGLYNDFNKTEMNSFLTLTEEEILAVIDYVRYWDDPVKYPPPVTAGPATPSDESGKGGISARLLLIILVASLLVITLVLARVTHVLGRIVLEKEGAEIPREVPFFLNKKLLTLIAILGVSFIGYRLADGAISLGRQQGYAPAQPIAFSHKIHAGINQIDCKYCHIGRGKQATIPTVNICMNCHKAVSEGTTTGKVEIAKIYAAAGWDPESQTYDPSAEKAIEWVRIHNLPDHVYFNHAQHVKVAEIACQQCHGPIETMDVVEQFAPLSMGFCVNCHRDTEVKFASNEYYAAHYRQFHEDLVQGHIDGVTAEMIGATECQKCHY